MHQGSRALSRATLAGTGNSMLCRSGGGASLEGMALRMCSGVRPRTSTAATSARRSSSALTISASQPHSAAQQSAGCIAWSRHGSQAASGSSSKTRCTSAAEFARTAFVNGDGLPRRGAGGGLGGEPARPRSCNGEGVRISAACSSSCAGAAWTLAALPARPQPGNSARGDSAQNSFRPGDGDAVVHSWRRLGDRAGEVSPERRRPHGGLSVRISASCSSICAGTAGAAAALPARLPPLSGVRGDSACDGIVCI
mmetsp:Transcript_79763/g.234638  ORF Transcript_79763/g.234638 Transcript_79763/m.234638 type:complete len:254 (-) Transcript_79763:89-850(-)